MPTGTLHLGQEWNHDETIYPGILEFMKGFDAAFQGKEFILGSGWCQIRL